jgi:hypothetical protein
LRDLGVVVLERLGGAFDKKAGLTAAAVPGICEETACGGGASLGCACGADLRHVCVQACLGARTDYVLGCEHVD